MTNIVHSLWRQRWYNIMVLKALIGNSGQDTAFLMWISLGCYMCESVYEIYTDRTKIEIRSRL